MSAQSDGLDLTTSRSTDGGVTWATLSNNLLNDGLENDREYLWTDQNPASPFYGRTYVTEANFGFGGSSSYISIAVRATTDGGVTWSPVNALVQSNEFALGTNHNEYPSLAILPNGQSWPPGTVAPAAAPSMRRTRSWWRARPTVASPSPSRQPL